MMRTWDSAVQQHTVRTCLEETRHLAFFLVDSLDVPVALKSRCNIENWISPLYTSLLVL